MFRDKFNREIKIGHVLANGGRDGCSGIIRTGIVRGFTEGSVLVDMIIPVSDSYNATIKNHTQWKTRRGSFREPKLCIITGLDSATFLDSVNFMFKDPEPVEIIGVVNPIWHDVLSAIRGTVTVNYGSHYIDAVEPAEDVNTDE